MKTTKKLKYLVLITLILLSISCSLYAAFKDTGWGVRPIGMGGAFTAVADDSNAQLYNPAGLVRVPQKEVSLMSEQLFYGLDGVDIGLGYLGYVQPVSRKFGSFGVAWGALSSPALYREDTASLGYGRFMNDLLGFSQPAVSIGVNIKYLKHEYTLDERTANDPVFANANSASATSGDIGALISWEKTGLSCAVTSRNINSPNVGLLTADQVPDENVVAISYYTKQLPYLKLKYFTAALDYTSTNDIENSTDIKFGAETKFFDSKFAVRAGGSQEQITFGLGYEVKISEKTKIIIDYALAWPLQVENTSGSQIIGLTIYLP